MSDTFGFGYDDRSDEEMEAMEKELASMTRRGYQYVAEPAPGYDVRGLWHTFPCHSRTGYAAHAVALHTSLERMGIPTMLAPHPSMDVDIEFFPKDRRAKLLRWTKKAVGLPQAYIASLPPDLVGARTGARAYICYSAFEALPVNEYGANIVNDPALTALWCVSPFSAQCYLSAGAKPAKVDVVPPAVCDRPWRGFFRQPEERPPVTSDQPYRFGVVGTWHERKGFYNLIRAYFSEFKRDEPVVLELRTSYMGSGKPTLSTFEQQVISEIGSIASEFGDHGYPRSKLMPRIKLITGTQDSDRQLIRWLSSFDCYVNPSFGEGLGIPHIWATAQGVPIVTSNFGAVGELAQDLHQEVGESAGSVFSSHLVPVPEDMKKHSPYVGLQTRWGGYHVQDLARSMRSVFEARLGKSPEMAKYVRNRFSFANTRGALSAALGKHLESRDAEAWLR